MTSITALETIVREAYRTGPDTITFRAEVGYPTWILTLGGSAMAVGYDESEPVEDPDDETAVMIDWTTYMDADMQDIDTQDGGTLGDARDAIAAWIAERSRTEYGTLTDYRTGEEIRPATAGERQQSLAASETGAFGLDGRTVFVAG